MALRTESWRETGRPFPLFIGGKWVYPPAATTLVVDNPATGQVLAEVVYADASAASQAAEAAAAAFDDWAGRSPKVRSEVLSRTAELLVERSEPIGHLLALETGKRKVEAVAEVRLAAGFFQFYAEEVRRARGEVLTSEDPRRRQLTIQRPAGVTASLTPWNFPISLQARKLAPALAAGCTVVARPSEKAPLGVHELFLALEEAGAPPGVANLVQGPARELAGALLAHRAVRVLTFTGSTQVGAELMRRAAERVVRVALELGGDAPFIVFADADFDEALTGLMTAKFRNNGQSCIAANRIYVERPMFEAFLERLGKETAAMHVGDPVSDEGCDLGPLIDEEHASHVRQFVDDALARGARVVGDQPPMPRAPCFVAPAFLRDVPEDAALACSEIFGPVAAVFPFADEEEVVSRANSTEMGLAGYAYTTSAARQWRLAEALEVGILGLNHPLPAAPFAPLGGVKQSGIGREGARHGLEEFIETRYVSIGI